MVTAQTASGYDLGERESFPYTDSQRVIFLKTGMTRFENFLKQTSCRAQFMSGKRLGKMYQNFLGGSRKI